MVKERVYSKSIYQLLDMEKAKEKLSGKQKRRLKVFKEKRAVLDALWTGECTECKTPLHKDIDFCSSKCYRKHHGYPTREEYYAKKDKGKKQDKENERHGTKET